MSTVATVHEAPLLMRPELVREALADRKTQTRRLVNDAPADADCFLVAGDGSGDVKFFSTPIGHVHVARSGWIPCPYGRPGERLWVRENWNVRGLMWGRRPSDAAKYAAADAWVYAATPPDAWLGGWRPSIHMPRAACRLVLEITDVRVERLQEITSEDILAEGIRIPTHDGRALVELVAKGRPAACEYLPKREDPSFTVDELLRAQFAATWDGINRKRATWAENPWVWVITFKQAEAR